MGFDHLMAKLGKAAKMPFAVQPHMLRQPRKSRNEVNVSNGSSSSARKNTAA
jgi:hypothetical protein